MFLITVNQAAHIKFKFKIFVFKSILNMHLPAADVEMHAILSSYISYNTINNLIFASNG